MYCIILYSIIQYCQHCTRIINQYYTVVKWYVDMVMSCLETSIPKYVSLWKGWSSKSWEECVRKDLEPYVWRREDAYQFHYETKLELKLLPPASLDNGIKTIVAVCCVSNHIKVHVLLFYLFPILIDLKRQVIHHFFLISTMANKF